MKNYKYKLLDVKRMCVIEQINDYETDEEAIQNIKAIEENGYVCLEIEKNMNNTEYEGYDYQSIWKKGNKK